MGGKGAVIVPDGVLFGSANAHVALRKRLIEENRLDGVVSMPSGVFRPYAGVSTAALFFTRGAKTEDIWFYDMAHDGFSLDDKRLPVQENDIPDVLRCWQNRQDLAFREGRQERLKELKTQAAPLKSERLGLLGEINRLTFEQAPCPPTPPHSRGVGEGELEGARGGRLAELEAGITPLQREINQLSRQFWVSKATVRANKYDLSASRYREVEAEEAYYEKPEVTLERLRRLEEVMVSEIRELEGML